MAKDSPKEKPSKSVPSSENPENTGSTGGTGGTGSTGGTEKRYPRRVTLDLTDEQYEWLRGAAFEARTPMSAIVRAMVQLGSDKKKTAAKAIALAKEEAS